MTTESQANESVKNTEIKEITDGRNRDILLSVAWSVFKKVGTILIIYLFGYMHWSFSWLLSPVIFLVIHEQWQHEKQTSRYLRKAAAMYTEKEIILSRLKDDLPAWVYFPDTERSEWLNQILKQLWPNVNAYVRTYIKDKVEPKLAKTLKKKKLSGFRFDRLILGSIPPRFDGIKVYEKNISRNEIIMDVHFAYAGDCDISFTLSGIKGGIKDFQMRGLMRVIMKPLIPFMPLVGGVQVFFLNDPKIDFNMVGAADILDMPGLSELIRRTISEQIAHMMVLPNRMPFVLSKHISAESVLLSEPEGVLRIHVVEGKHLMKKDIGMLGKGKSDPYAVISVGSQEFRTKTIDNTVNPKWDYWCECIVSEAEGQEILLHVWDKDDGPLDDETLGRATVEIGPVVRKGELDTWVTLEHVKHGMIHVRMVWLKLSTDYSDLKCALEETQILRVSDLTTALFMLYVDSAKHLPMARAQSNPDPYAVVTIGKSTQQTNVHLRSDCPVWEQGFTFLVPNPDTDTMTIKILDNKTSTELGTFVYNLINLNDKPKLKMDVQPFPLDNAGPNSTITLSFSLRILRAEMPVFHDEIEGNSSPGTIKNHLDRHRSLSRGDSTVSVGSISVLDASPKRGSFYGIKRQESNKEVPPPVLGLVDSGDEDETVANGSPERIVTKAFVGSRESTPTKNVLRHRSTSVESVGTYGLGKIQLTLRYSQPRQRLIVVVHKILNLPQKDPTNIPDPYVKLYLLPERAKDSKRKTSVIKDNCNPVYDESFEYVLSQGELNSHMLEISVITQKSIFSGGNNTMGQVVIDLSKSDLTQTNTLWLDLQPGMSRD